MPETPVRVQWFGEGTTETCRIDCQSPCSDPEECLFHDRDLFAAFSHAVINKWRLRRSQHIEVRISEDGPSIEITAEFWGTITTSTIQEKIIAFRLPRLKTICRNMLFQGSLNFQLSLFKALLQRKFDIAEADLDSVEAQTYALLF